jgi:tetratricopeptide (TPR) repeat protein
MSVAPIYSPSGATLATQQPSGAFGLEQATGASVDARILEDSLPSTFSSFVLNREDIPGFTHAKPPEWAQSTANFAYYNPADLGGIPGIIVSAHELQVDWNIGSALEFNQETDRERLANYLIEADNLTEVGKVKFVIATGVDRTNVSQFKVSWGASDGRWLFEIATHSIGDREVFAKTLASSITAKSTDGDDSDLPPLGKIIKGTPESTSVINDPETTPTDVPTSTRTPRPTITPSATMTPRPKPTATPDEATDIAQTEAAAIECLEQGRFSCAVDLFSEALERHPSSFQLKENLYLALMVYGMSREEAEDIEDARKQYQRAFDLDPTRIEASRALDNIRPYSEILYGDGLREENGQFSTGTMSFADFYYANDSLVIRAKNGQGGFYNLSQSKGKPRTSIAVDFGVVEWGDGYVSVGYQDRTGNDAYFLQFNVNDYRWNFVHAYGETGLDELIPWADVEPLATEGSFRIELRLVDSIFYILVNGDYVGSIASQSFVSGEATFGCGFFSDSQSRTFAVAFNNVRIFEFE